MSKKKSNLWFWHRITKYDEHPEQVWTLFALEHEETTVILNLSEIVELRYVGILPKSTPAEEVVKQFQSTKGGDR